MNCRTARRQMTDLFEGGNPPASTELDRHLQDCAACARELEQLTATFAALAPPPLIRASSDFKERTMSKLTDRLATPGEITSGRSFRWPHLTWKIAPVAAAIALVIALPYFASRGSAGSSPTTLLAQSTEAVSKLKSVHLIGRMRTLPNDNFELIGVEYPFVPVEMWKEFGDQPRWRIQKPGRVAVMDGTSSLLFYGGDQAVRGGRNPGFVEWLMPLLDVESVLASELAVARTGQMKGTLTAHEAGGAKRLILTSLRTAQGKMDNDWCRNKSINESDHTRLYTFDAGTSRLTALQVMIQNGGEKLNVLEINEIRYNEVLDPSLFTIQLPANVVWATSPEQMPTANRPLPATPREAAAAFLEGMAAQDWDRVASVRNSGISQKLKDYGGGLTVISIGEPFQSGLYKGWFVPYEVRLRNGVVKKWNLAVRNDNPAKRFHHDGGF